MLVLISKLTKKIITIIVATALIVTGLSFLQIHKRSSSRVTEKPQITTPSPEISSCEDQNGSGSPTEENSQGLIEPQTLNSCISSCEDQNDSGSPTEENSQGLIEPQTLNSCISSCEDQNDSGSSIEENHKELPKSFITATHKVTEPQTTAEQTSDKDSLDLDSNNLALEPITNNVSSKIEVETDIFVPQICEDPQIEVISESLKNDSNNSLTQKESTNKNSEFKTVESSDSNDSLHIVAPVTSPISGELFEKSTKEASSEGSEQQNLENSNNETSEETSHPAFTEVKQLSEGSKQ